MTSEEYTIENEQKINPNVSKIMDYDTFVDGIEKGIYSDDKGTAYLILNGILYNTYNVYIDREKITKAGSVVSFESLLKSYDKKDILIRYDLKKMKRRSLNAYLEARNKKNKEKKNQGK